MSAAASIAETARGCGSVLREGELLKLGGKQKDKWQQVDVRVATGIGLCWSTGSRLRDTAMGSQKNLAPAQIVRAAYYSEIGVEFAFEVTSTAKGGKVYKFVAASDVDRDHWIEAIEHVAEADTLGGQTLVPPSIDPDIGRQPELDMPPELPQHQLEPEVKQESEGKPPELEEAVESSEDPDEESRTHVCNCWRCWLTACIGIVAGTYLTGRLIGEPALWYLPAMLLGFVTGGFIAMGFMMWFGISLVDSCCVRCGCERRE